MEKKKTSFLRHLADLIIQNKTLLEENEKLHKQVDHLSNEVSKYEKLLAQSKNPIKEIQVTNPKIKKNIKYKTSTVLFAETEGFNKISAEMDSKLLVDNLDEIFILLQSIIEKYEIRNARSIGDSFMCVGGIPRKNITNPIEVILAAIEMQFYIRELQRVYYDKKIWELKIGIHTGPVVASINSRKQNNYDIKGDTVNIATRIRSYCKSGEILISETTYELVKDVINCEYYGKMPVKYKGDLLMYSVTGIKSDYSLQGKGLIPNKKFSIRFSLIQFTDLQEMMLDKLEKELPQNLYYHNVKHTVDVVTQAELIGIGEGVTDEELVLLKTAALFHDSGHIYDYNDHEHYSIKIAKEILPDYYYTQSQIAIISGLIMATKLPPEPKTKLEEIMCDADLDYLGRSDMIPISTSLYNELKERGNVASLVEWNKMQIRFISNHQYFTNTARSLREVNKQKQIERIRNLVTAEA